MSHYRADIDVLRAIAVLAVTFLHYKVPGFGGGFVGVDVFFVISGYLIAAGIGSDLAVGRFSLLSFYERRIRRIIPALFVMYGLVLVASATILFPPESHTQSRMALLVVPFLANYAFFENAGAYGGEFANQIALLHTWSLAVEEQFYLLFPLLMVAIARFGAKRYVTVLGCLALCSLVLCVIAVRVIPRAAFYLPPFRAWELLTGALLAVGRIPPLRDPHVRGAVALLGLALIIGSSVFLSLDRPYPSELTLLPCVGAAAIIYANCGVSTPMGRLLGNPVMRRIGSCSYSIYLYHWPLLVLAQYYAFEPLAPLARAALLVVSILLAALSWRYVEQPFRGPNAWLQRPAVFGLAAATGAALMVVAAGIYLQTRVSQYTHQQSRSFPSDTAAQLRCRNTSPEQVQKPPCILGEATAPVAAVLWGDSHALAVLPAVDAAYARHHEAVMLAQHGGCPPLLGVRIRIFQPAQSQLLHSWLEAAGYGKSEACKRHTDAVLDWIISHHIRTVILAGHWIAYTESANRQWLSDSESPGDGSARDNTAIFARGLERLLAVLQREHVRVFVFEDVPQSPVYVPYALAAARRRGLELDFRITRAQYDSQQSSPTEVFERLRKQYTFHILEPQELLCAGGKCAVANNADSLYVDDEHLSALGAMVTEPAFEMIWRAGPAG
ncbi:MAG: acyltransferase [Proteobacteria bacterium]|nr:acyltransferase [Pseudomonadota bacterium]